MLEFSSELTGTLAKEHLLRTFSVNSPRDETSSRIAVYFGNLRKQIWLTDFADYEPDKPMESVESVESMESMGSVESREVMEFMEALEAMGAAHKRMELRKLRSHVLQLGTIFDELQSTC